MQTGKKGHLINLIVTTIIFLVTFPRFVPDYGTGLDPSYVWAYNYLIHIDFSLLTDLTYPIGPLGFLKYTAAYENNLAIALVFFSLVKFSFILLLLKVSRPDNGIVGPFPFLITLIGASFAGIDFSIVASTVLLLILYYDDRKKLQYFMLANVFAMTGILIKSSIGLSAYASIFVFMLITLFSDRFTLKKTFILGTVSLLIFIVSGSVVFGGVGSFYSFIHGLLRLAGGYSEGLALFPENNWWLLSGFILIVTIVPFEFRDSRIRVAYFLLLLPLFAMWKHALGREDVFHAQLLVGFLVIFWSILILIRRKRKVWPIIILAVLSIGFYYLNLYNINGFSNIRPQLTGLTNFNETVLDYTKFNARYDSISKRNIRQNELNKATKELIGKATIDIYPWDLSYIPANNFNWKPRKTIELGASTSSWLSRLAATNYKGSEAPDFIIVHFKDDQWGGKLGTLDGRNLLNDEPAVLFNFLNNYQIQARTKKYLLLKKLAEPATLLIDKEKNEIVKWNEWLPVLSSADHLVQVTFNNNKSLLGHLKSFLYKGEAYFIDYKFSDGKVLTYRFLQSNAEDGLWIFPFVLRPDKIYKEQEVQEIRFRCSNIVMVSDQIDLSWQTSSFADGRSAWGWFGKSEPFGDETLLEIKEDFESITDKSSSDSYHSQHAESIQATKFSTSLDLDLATLWKNDLAEIDLQVELFYKNVNQSDGKAMLVLSIDQSAEDVWLSFPLDDRNLPDEWKYAVLNKTLFREAHKNGKIKAYVWNNGAELVLIDDFKLRLTK